MVILLNDASDVPVYQQIRNQIVIGISDGLLLPGERLPTVRALAEEIGINSMTVNKAYQLLKQEGYIITDRRNGAIVQCASGKKKAVERKVGKELELLAAEAKIAGISQEEFLQMCRKAYGGHQA